MQFLVRLEVDTPPDWDAERLQALRHAETIRALALIENGTIERLFRVPGLRGNIGLWNAPSPEALHDTLTTLPMWGVMRAEVTSLMGHPHEQKFAESHASARGGLAGVAP